MQPKILLFVPAYNCAPQIPRVIEQVRNSKVLPFIHEVMVINDRSKDDTLNVALSIAPPKGVNWKVMTSAENYGLGGVHKAAFGYAVQNGFTHAIVLHGDDQGRLDDAFGVISAGLHLRHGAVLGSRFAVSSSLEGYSKFRIFGNHVFNALFSLALRARVRDLGSGLNIFGLPVMQSPNLQRMADDLTFNVHLLVDMFTRREEVSPIFFPLSWREDDQVSNVKLVRQTIRTTKILLSSGFNAEGHLKREHRTKPRESYDLNMEFSV